MTDLGHRAPRPGPYRGRGDELGLRAEMASRHDARASRGVEKGRREADPFLPFNPNRGNYPFVTTGGGALPLPVLAQPTMLRRARTAAVASASC
jgi:hypothetical protein